MAIEFWRGACPPEARPCGDACPYTERVQVDRVELSPRAPALRRLAERAYCVALVTGETPFVGGGCQGSVQFELVRDAGAGSEAPPRIRALCISTPGSERVVPTSVFTRPLLVRARNRDAYTTGRIGPGYWASAVWEETAGQRRARRVSAPRWMLGRDVVAGDFGALEAVADSVELTLPAAESPREPLIEVVWRDSDGLARATAHAAANPERESAFVLIGSMHFCERTRTAYTCVDEVLSVDRYEVRDVASASISPESMRAARNRAREQGLHLVGVLHSHVLERDSTHDHVDGLFYSSVDADDHANFLPPAWSLGGVLNVHPDASVTLALFAQDGEGEFAALPRMLRIDPTQAGSNPV